MVFRGTPGCRSSGGFFGTGRPLLLPEQTVCLARSQGQRGARPRHYAGGVAEVAWDAVSVEEAAPGQRTAVERLWQLYRHDLSEFRDSWPGPDGLFPDHDLHTYFGRDPNRASYVIRCGSRLAGFAMIGGLQGMYRSIEAFFVVRRARRRAVGLRAATALIAGYDGCWEIGFQESNVAAARFWRDVASHVATESREEARPVPGKPGIRHIRVLILGRTPAPGQ